MKVVDKTGLRFGMLTVIKRAGSNGTVSLFECLCDCGNTVIKQSPNLKPHRISSCGCYGVTVATLAKVKHGQVKTRIYRIWSNMRQRCQNTENDNYSFYGARGIKVCDRWETFANFYDDMKDGYADNLTLERIDNFGNYEKINCKWISHKSQCRNRRSSVYLEFNGKTLSYVEWGELIGINGSAISKRIKRGWTVEQTLTVPYKMHLSLL